LCGISHNNDWSKHPERLEGLLAALAKTSMKNSLQEIDVKDCGMRKKKVMEMVEKHGLTNIKEIFD
jgi:hypothetical protein